MILNAQTPSWDWAKSAAGSEGSFEDVFTGISVDNNGNTYSAGFFKSATMTFGDVTLNNSSNTYYHDAFVVKYDPDGTVIWGKAFGGVLSEDVKDIKADPTGNTYVLGDFSSSSVTFGTVTLTNSGSHDLFLLKLDSAGDVVWAKGIGGTGTEYADALTIDQNGDILVLADFASPSLTIGTITLNSAGYNDILIAKYTSAGNPVWAKSMGGSGSDVAQDIATDSNNNIAITGRFSSPSITDGTGTITNTSNTAIFVIKFNSFGTYQWSDSWSGSSANAGKSVAFDAQGNVFMLAHFDELTVTFGSVTLNCSTTSDGLIKYNSSGTVSWGKTIATGKILGSSIATNSLDQIIVAGTTICPQVVFGGCYLNNASNGNDMLVVKYAANGNEAWGVIAGGTSEEYVRGIDVDASGDVYIYGLFLSTTLPFSGTTLNHTSAGQSELFIAKLNASTTMGIEESTSGNTITIYPNPMALESNIQSNGDAIVSVRVLDESGQVICVTDKAIIERGEMTAGMYFVETTDTKGNIQTQKLVIE